MGGYFKDGSESSVFTKVVIFSNRLVLFSKKCWARPRDQLSGFRIRTGIRDFSLPWNVQTGSGAHLTKRSSIVFNKLSLKMAEDSRNMLEIVLFNGVCLLLHVQFIWRSLQVNTSFAWSVYKTWSLNNTVMYSVSYYSWWSDAVVWLWYKNRMRLPNILATLWDTKENSQQAT